MKTRFTRFSLLVITICLFQGTPQAQNVVGSVMNEVFKQTTLGTNLNDPWEVTFGPDGYLWITEAKGYVVVRMDTATGVRDTVLNLAPGATGFLTAGEHTLYNRENWTNPPGVPWPQGGMMGMALHPDFMHPTTPKKYVYIGYVADQGSVPTNNSGQYYTNFLVRFTLNTVTGRLGNPVTLCDTLPGSKDHNSGRIVIAPIGGINYLFYSSGDMGSGQFENLTRPVKVQNLNSYEGKILRFNLEEDGDAVQNIGPRAANYNRWIPSTGVAEAANPYNATLGVQSAVWNTGHRNVQGFAIANFAGNNYIYGSSHGPYSDDEVNVMEAGKNYGHPLVIGDSTDGNYNNAKAGPVGGTLPLIANVNGEQLNARAMGTTYKNPLYSFYPVAKGSITTCSNPNQYHIQDIYRNCAGTGNNNFWKSEAPSGMDIYTKSAIPGWTNSLILASLKWGRVLRVKLNSLGTAVIPVNGVVDTMPYFKSQNRYRDIAISPDGRDMFVIMDKSASTSGPSQANPSALNCGGCVVKYRFLGYNDVAGASTISTAVGIAPGKANALTNGTPTVINADNNNIWVPITDSLGNIIAEIDANGNNLGNITASLYKNVGPIRTSANGTPYMDRSITINVQTQPAAGNPVNVRLYLTAAELAALVASPTSGVTNINQVSIKKNADPNGSVIASIPTTVTPTARTLYNADHVLKASISSFSTFYFTGPTTTLASYLVSLSGKYNNQSINLQWKTIAETNSSYFSIERSNDGKNFRAIGSQAAAGNSTTAINYAYNDQNYITEASKLLYYRIKMVDASGAFQYSNIINVDLPGFTGTTSIFPNPVNQELKANILSPVDEQVSWWIYDNTGRILSHNSTWVKKGNNELLININSLTAGLYYLKVTGAVINSKTKFQKL